jgi:ribonuclease E
VVVGHVSLVKARLSPGPALFLLNNKKGELARLESKYQVNIFILADGRLTQDEYEFELESKKLSPGEVAPPPPVAARSPIREEPEEEDPEDEDLEEVTDEDPAQTGAPDERSSSPRHDRIKHRRLRFRPRPRRRDDEGGSDNGKESPGKGSEDNPTGEAAPKGGPPGKQSA